MADDIGSKAVSDNPQDYKKFCGLGVTGSFTPLGVRLSLLPSSIATPAMKAGLQDGDILHRVYQGGRWNEIRNVSDFDGLVPGMEGTPLAMQIIRGVPQPPAGYRGLGPAPMFDWQSYADKHPPFEVTALRERVYSYLPDTILPQQLHEVPFRSLEDMLKCVPLSLNDVEAPSRLAGHHRKADETLLR